MWFRLIHHSVLQAVDAGLLFLPHAYLYICIHTMHLLRLSFDMFSSPSVGVFQILYPALVAVRNEAGCGSAVYDVMLLSTLTFVNLSSVMPFKTDFLRVIRLPF
jgi:hypothetical protein